MKRFKATQRAFDADIGQINELYAFLSDALRNGGVPEKYSPVMEMAADEIFSNIVKYAYKDVPAKRGRNSVVVELSVQDPEGGWLPRGQLPLELRFEDWGASFNPLTVAPPDLVSDAGERDAGGLGVFIVRSVMDEMRYSREGGRNVLTLVKFIEDDIEDA
jgi:anti-sigma regulatory factor (Ser/Thr protein kinase)